LSPATYGQEDEPIFLGKEIARHKDYSEETALKIDRAISEILDKARLKAMTILQENRAKLEKLIKELLEKETLADSDIRLLLGI
jgi:cell division protease FtsH